jgi:hypothetical protein
LFAQDKKSQEEEKSKQQDLVTKSKAVAQLEKELEDNR